MNSTSGMSSMNTSFKHVVPQPESMSILLTEQERSTVYQMELLENLDIVEVKTNDRFLHTRVGFNTSMGTSNIKEMVALLARNKQKWCSSVESGFIENRVISHAKGLVYYERIRHHDCFNSTLVVVSHDTMFHWVSVLNQTMLSYAVIIKPVDLEKLNMDSNHDVILVSHARYNSLLNMTSKKAWKRVVFNDPVYFSIPNMLWVTAGFYWIVTPSPYMLGTLSRKSTKNKMIKDIVLDYDKGYTDICTKFAGLIVQTDQSEQSDQTSQSDTGNIGNTSNNTGNIAITSGMNSILIV